MGPENVEKLKNATHFCSWFRSLDYCTRSKNSSDIVDTATLWLDKCIYCFYLCSCCVWLADMTDCVIFLISLPPVCVYLCPFSYG